jgi:hypothetical protein
VQLLSVQFVSFAHSPEILYSDGAAFEEKKDKNISGKR